MKNLKEMRELFWKRCVALMVEVRSCLSQTEKERKELELHVQQNHVPKHSSFAICLASDCPVKKHQCKPEKTPNVLHADLGGPYTASRDGIRYILVREVKQAMQQQLSFIEALAHPSLNEVGQIRVLRIQTDRGLEFCSEMFESMCRESNRCNIASQLDMTPRAMKQQSDAKE
eukprot:2928401-Amphidinium_carterae.1